MTSTRRAYIGLGSNLEDPVLQVSHAIERLRALPGTTLVAASRLYRTLPWGDTEQPPFVNAVVALDTSLAPRALLEHLRAIESAAGRLPARRWGPRVLDLDLLVHGEACIDEDGMRVPHAHLHERAFVLVPLAEIAPLLEVPGQGRVDRLLAAVDRGGVDPIAPLPAA